MLIFMKLKKQNVVCEHEFSWFTKKVVCTTYNILGISALIVFVSPLIVYAIFGEN